MRRTALLTTVVLLVSVVTAAAQEKKCKAMKEDGTVLAELAYESGKYGECLDKLKAEVAGKLCGPTDKKVKFQLQKDADTPRTSSADCSLAAAAAEKSAPSEPAEPAAEERQKDATEAPKPLTCEEQKTYLLDNAAHCGAADIYKKWSCDTPAEAKGIGKAYEKCAKKVEKHEGDPGEAACTEALEHLKAQECGAAKIMVAAAEKGKDCATVEGRRALVNSRNVCEKK
ncbi:MAG: hypothetical protein HYV63_17335 [Candidatus Schekmanbacteria bacterium]|nr:hypothetical protein [Candidatus Schekmanbacteria bacterium]